VKLVIKLMHRSLAKTNSGTIGPTGRPRHLPYRITQRSLPDGGKRVPLWLVLDLLTPKGWKDELPLLLIVYTEIISVGR